jgi:hypothetical protein
LSRVRVPRDAAAAAASSSGDADSKSSIVPPFDIVPLVDGCESDVEFHPWGLVIDDATPAAVPAPATGGGRALGSSACIRSLYTFASALIPGLMASISSMHALTSARYARYRALCLSEAWSRCLPIVSTTSVQKAIKTRKSSCWLPSSL